MKKLLLLLFAAGMTIFTYGQFPLKGATIGMDKTLTDAPGAIRTKIIVEQFVDTTNANLGPIKYYPGALIYTLSPDAFWKRNSTATKWQKFIMEGEDSLHVLAPLEILDSLNGKAYLKCDGCTGSGGTGTGLRHIMAISAPVDTTVGWIDIAHGYLLCYPVRYRVNGAWTALDTIGGKMYDAIGNVFTRGRPIVILGIGQSNLEGPYRDDGVLSLPSLYAYQGDTLPTPSVAAYNYATHSWGIGQIRVNPFASTSGANYMLLSAKKMSEHTGRSVRIVMQYRGGTALDCWAGAPSATIDTSLSCYKELVQRIDSSGIKKPDLVIWAQSESGASVPDSFYRRWRVLIDTLRKTHRIDSSSLILSMSSGNPDQSNSLTGAGADNALRQTQYDDDPYTKYIEGFFEVSDGIHYPPLAHEHFATKIFRSWLEGPVNPLNTMTGYNAYTKKASPFLGISDDVYLMATGLNLGNKRADSYIKLGNGVTFFGDGDSSILNKGAGLKLERNVGNGALTLKDYTQNYGFEMGSDGNIKAVANLFYATGTVRSQTGSNPTFELYDVTTGKKWKIISEDATNHLAFLYDNTILLHLEKTGEMGIGTASPSASAKVDIVSTTQGFLPPRMTATQASAISSPAEGLMVYVTNTNGTFTSKGWWGYDGAAWQKLNN